MFLARVAVVVEADGVDEGGGEGADHGANEDVGEVVFLVVDAACGDEGRCAVEQCGGQGVGDEEAGEAGVVVAEVAFDGVGDVEVEEGCGGEAQGGVAGEKGEVFFFGFPAVGGSVEGNVGAWAADEEFDACCEKGSPAEGFGEGDGGVVDVGILEGEEVVVVDQVVE